MMLYQEMLREVDVISGHEPRFTNYVGGAQDMYSATFGGFNFIEFYDKKRVIVNPLRIKSNIINELEASSVLYYTNISRSASQIEDEKRRLLKKKKSLEAMHVIKNDAIKMKEAILKGIWNRYQR